MPGNQSPSPLRNIDKVLDDSQHTGDLVLKGRKLKSFPKNFSNYDLIDTCKADLSRNQFAEVPEEICLFQSLEHLNLSHNLIRSLPYSITTLNELLELNISHNLLCTFPSFVCELRHLQVLSLNGNKINSIPEEIGQLSKLTSLDMSCNDLTHLPNQLGDLSSLKDFNLRRNQLIELPICLTRLKLHRLDISCNRIAHIPCDFRKVTSLNEINVEGNPLVSPPAHLCLRGLVHIMKFLHKEATKHEHRSGLNSVGSIQRRLKRSSSFSATSDGRLVGLDRNRSYNIGQGLPTLGRNFSTDRSDKNETPKFDKVNIESSTTSTSFKQPNQDVCSNIENSTSSPLSLNRGRHTNSQLQLTTTSSSSILFANNNTTPSTTANKTTTTDIINNFTNNSKWNDLHQKSLTNQAQTASHQLEMWINGLQNNNTKTSSNAEVEPNKTLESADAITKELLRQKAESETKKKKIENLKTRLDAAKTEAEKNSILQQYSMDLKTDAGSVNNLSNEKISSNNHTTIIPSSSHQPINSWSNSNTLPRCGPAKDVFEQPFVKQKIKLPNLKILNFRNTSDEGTKNLGNNKEAKQSKIIPVTRTNGTVAASDAKNISKHEVAVVNGVKSNLSDKEKAQVEKMRKSIESILKISLPVENLESSLKDGVILCHLVNHVRPRAVSCIHVSSQSAPVLSMPKIRRNVDNFLLACKRVGVDQGSICQASAIVEDFTAVSLATTVNALVSYYSRPT